MLGQQPTVEKYWSIDTTRELATGERYLFLVAVSSATTEDATWNMLTSFGWNVVSFNAPPADYQKALQVLLSQNLPQANIWQVIGTWTWPASTLPANTGPVYYGPVYVEVTVVNAPPGGGQQPQQPPQQAPQQPSAWPAVLTALAGVAVVGGIWWYASKHPGHALENPLQRDCGGWDPNVPGGWNQCDPRTIPPEARRWLNPRNCGYYVMKYGGGRYGSVAWASTRAEAQREVDRIKMTGAWSGMPPKVEPCRKEPAFRRRATYVGGRLQREVA